MRRLSILLRLAEKGAHAEPCEITSRELGAKIDCSQQTAARWLNKLSEEGLIEREVGLKGQIITLTPKGIDLLQSLKREIDEVFGTHPESLTLSGQVISGLGEGSYYVGQEGYKKQFEEKLGFTPYPGTLDLELNKKSLKIIGKLQNYQGKRIKEFFTQERSFGGAKCFPATIKGIKVGIVLPDRTHHEDVIEVLAPVKLRDKFGLEDGDEVSVEVEI